MGKETLKEFAEKYSVDKRHKKKLSNREFDFAKNDFINGAKWQQEQLFKDDVIQTLEKGIALLLKKQEQMYSEEEVIQLVEDFKEHLVKTPISGMLTFKVWFEQFKKK